MSRESTQARVRLADSEFGLRNTLRRVSGLSADEVLALPLADVVQMTKLLARSNYIAGADRTLTAEIAPRDRRELPFTRHSYNTALFRLALLALAVLITCGFFGRILL